MSDGTLPVAPPHPEYHRIIQGRCQDCRDAGWDEATELSGELIKQFWLLMMKEQKNNVYATG